MEPIIFQIIDWSQYNKFNGKKIDNSDSYSDSDNYNSDDSDYSESDSDSDTESYEDSETENTKKNKSTSYTTEYKIKLYGRTNTNNSIYVHVNNFKPFFYVKLSLTLSEKKISKLINQIKKSIENYKIKRTDFETGKISFETVTVATIKAFENYEIIKSKDLYGFTAYKEFTFLKLIFKNMKSYKAYENFIENSKILNKEISTKPISLQVYESNIEPFIRCMHIQRLNACGWVQVDNYKKLPKSTSHCAISIDVDWDELKPYESNEIQRFVIASYDIECMSNSGNFPQAYDPKDKTNPGDPIIQIGTVFSYYGESEPFMKSILTLNGCAEIKGLEDVEIQSFSTEKKLLLAWTKLIQKYDPDILTGWNINGFDFKYMYDRANKLGILDNFSLLSRIKGEKSMFKQKKLSSSALGDNLLKYFDMGGRIIIDLMKVQQRDAKLDSYKLDFVASTYIKEKIILCEQTATSTIIYTNGIYGIKEEDYINITWDDGLSENKHDQKYKIISLEKISSEELNILVSKIQSYPDYNEYEYKKPKSLYKLIISGFVPDEIFTEGNELFWHNVIDYESENTKLYFFVDNYKHENHENHENNEELTETEPVKWIDMELEKVKRPIKGNKIFWAHAKDDISPNELFRLYRGTDEDRGIIAKYCIMDCVLVTKLMEKLQVLNNNIGMANVCNVPLNYIFMRGQGVKIFSLVSKRCRELGFLIPKLTVNNNFSDELDTYKRIYDDRDDEEDTDDEDNNDNQNNKNNQKVGYEGATVFPPVKGIHYEPIPVLDYASLYPRSMIYINISHECFVNDPEYETVTFNNNDGTSTTCRFAKHKDETKGVLCSILIELLDKRSSTKKLMEKAKAEGNNFLSAIYDGLQLAYKVTANSLYGQVGAPTSPIYMKELAASTTATGR